jgi:hypothetical protein
MLIGSALGAIRTHAQGQTPPDFSNVEMKTAKLANNFYTLEGLGGTTDVLVARGAGQKSTSGGRLSSWQIKRRTRKNGTK